MIGITAALYDEGYEVIRNLQYEKRSGIGAYYGEVSGKPVSFFLTRPGIKKKTKLIQWIRNHRFECIINTGFAGALRPGFQIGDILHPDVIIQSEKPGVSIHPEKSVNPLVLYTSSRPVLTTDEKEYYRQKYTADLVDMEAYIFHDLIGRSGYNRKIRFVKIIGDRFGDESLMQKEIFFRNFFSSDKRFFQNARNKLKIIAETGIFASYQLYRHKRYLQKVLWQTISEEIFC